MKSATETVSGSQTWKQTFLYDRYGNRNFDTPNTTTLGSCPTAVCNPTVSTSNNRFSSGQGHSYDNSGNTTVDANGRQFTYDAENKQTLVKDASNVTIGTYYYDGDGKRVKKTSGSDSVIFVYDAAGRLVEEYPTSSPTSVSTAYVYAGSRLLTTETSGGTNYVTNDNLGSPRINTNASGGVISRHDYMPFGEDAISSQRTAHAEYTSDNVRKKFTGYERDDETGLDYAKARTYSSTLGRFNQCDPIYVSKEHPPNPQKWNVYLYVINNPLRYTDPDGLKPRVIDIFITIGVDQRNEQNAKRDWYELAKKAPKGTIVNIYTVDDGTATVQQFTKSLKTAGTTVLVFGHSVATDEDIHKAEHGGRLKGLGLTFSNGDFKGNSAQPRGEPNESVDTVSAKNILLFTCASGPTGPALLNRMTRGGEMVKNDNRPDGETSIKGQEEAAYAAAETIIAGGGMQAAKDAAQNAINANGQDPNDRIRYFYPRH